MLTEDDFKKRVGEELKIAREAMGWSCEDAADYFQRQRSWMSKIERATTRISFYDYLTLMDYYRELIPTDHPGLTLARYMKKQPVSGEFVSMYDALLIINALRADLPPDHPGPALADYFLKGRPPRLRIVR